MYVITASESEELETEIFTVGEEDDDIEAAMAFSNELAAREFLEASDSGDTHTVAEIEPIDFVGWLLELHHNGVQLLILDPKFDLWSEGEPQVAVDIASQLSGCEERIMELARQGQ